MDAKQLTPVSARPPSWSGSSAQSREFKNRLMRSYTDLSNLPCVRNGLSKDKPRIETRASTACAEGELSIKKSDGVFVWNGPLPPQINSQLLFNACLNIAHSLKSERPDGTSLVLTPLQPNSPIIYENSNGGSFYAFRLTISMPETETPQHQLNFKMDNWLTLVLSASKNANLAAKRAAKHLATMGDEVYLALFQPVQTKLPAKPVSTKKHGRA
ncbi:Uncharacterised protein [Candidatus Anstonella stagnisolia]|nr:Uncharacterised protein [Candidatus Anstonella stagnisolia]